MATVSSVFRPFYFHGAYKRNTTTAKTIGISGSQLLTWDAGTSFIRQNGLLANSSVNDLIHCFSTNKNVIDFLSLDFSSCDISPAEEVSVINLGRNKFSSFSFLGTWKISKDLKMILAPFNVSASNLNFFQNLPKTSRISHLQFNSCNISDLSPMTALGSLPILERLYFHFNQISDLSPLNSIAGSQIVSYLTFNANLISDLKPLDAFISSSLVNFSMTNNNLSSTEIIRFITLLNLKITTNASRTIAFQNNPGSAAASTDPAYITARDALIAKGCTITI